MMTSNFKYVGDYLWACSFQLNGQEMGKSQPQFLGNK